MTTSTFPAPRRSGIDLGNRVAAALRARDGASALEFAILSPIFFMALLAMMQTSLILFQQHLLDSATGDAVRTLILGEVQSAGTATAEVFKTNYLCPRLTGLFDCDRVIADVRVTAGGEPDFPANGWADIPIRPQAGSSYCVGSAGEYVYLRIAYPAPLIGVSLIPSAGFSSFQGETVAMLQSSGALRIEPVGVGRAGSC